MSSPRAGKIADNVVGFTNTCGIITCTPTAQSSAQIDRSKPAHQQSDPTLYAGVVKERDDGIIISGAQQLATAGVFSDYLHLGCIHPLQPGDENYANAVAVPINAPGLKLYPRRTFATAAMNSFDYPLSSRFDETDCFCVFDNVFVPW
jgi:4-hydroxyphenylacetate 3-monooxygenase